MIYESVVRVNTQALIWANCIIIIVSLNFAD